MPGCQRAVSHYLAQFQDPLPRCPALPRPRAAGAQPAALLLVHPLPRKVYRNSVAGTLAVAMMVELHNRMGTWTRKVDPFIALTNWAKEKFTQGGLPAERIVVKTSCVALPPDFGEVRRDGGLLGRLDE
jgi:hypothetical protein